MGGVEEVCPVGKVCFLLLVSVQRGLCFVYCHFMFLSVLIVSVSIWLVSGDLGLPPEGCCLSTWKVPGSDAISGRELCCPIPPGNFGLWPLDSGGGAPR